MFVTCLIQSERTKVGCQDLCTTDIAIELLSQIFTSKNAFARLKNIVCVCIACEIF